MTSGQWIRGAFIVGLWIFLVYVLLSRVERIDGMVVFTIVASAIIVFVPLYKKYLKKKS